MAKADRFYFENFAAAAELCCGAAAYLKECMENYDPSQVSEMLKKMHAIEHEADGKRHEMNATLAKAFVTPLDREDLAEISHDIDEVADCIEEVMQRFYVDRIETIHPEAIEFADHIVESCRLMKAILAELANFKKPQKLHELIVELNHQEEECDKLYLRATRHLWDRTSDVLTILSWRDVYDKLEACADACEHVGDVIATIVMKNT
jgi:predicted phosphate transport protein (TIGR00153 family)